MDLRWSHSEAACHQEIRDVLKVELRQDWHDTLMLGKASDKYIALAKSFTHKVSARAAGSALAPSIR